MTSQASRESRPAPSMPFAVPAVFFTRSLQFAAYATFIDRIATIRFMGWRLPRLRLVPESEWATRPIALSLPDRMFCPMCGSATVNRLSRSFGSLWCRCACCGGEFTLTVLSAGNTSV